MNIDMVEIFLKSPNVADRDFAPQLAVSAAQQELQSLQWCSSVQVVFTSFVCATYYTTTQCLDLCCSVYFSAMRIGQCTYLVHTQCLASARANKFHNNKTKSLQNTTFGSKKNTCHPNCKSKIFGLKRIPSLTLPLHVKQGIRLINPCQ